MFKRLLVVLVLLAGLAALPLAAGASVLEGAWDFLLGGQRPEAMSAEEVRAELVRLSGELAALGLGPARDDRIDGMVENYESIPEEYRGGLDLTHQLLYAVGMGDYDSDTGAWKPSSQTVYAFDMEVTSIDTMYTDFLQGVAAITRGEFAITGVQEDTSKADWDTNTGTQVLRFQYNGHPYEYAAAFQGDWLDMGVIAFLNGVLEAEGNPKRLYCFGDQIQVMFYDTPEWAARFEVRRATALSDAPFQ